MAFDVTRQTLSNLIQQRKAQQLRQQDPLFQQQVQGAQTQNQFAQLQLEGERERRAAMDSFIEGIADADNASPTMKAYARIAPGAALELTMKNELQRKAFDALAAGNFDLAASLAGRPLESGAFKAATVTQVGTAQEQFDIREQDRKTTGRVTEIGAQTAGQKEVTGLRTTSAEKISGAQIVSQEKRAKEALSQDFNKFQVGLQARDESELRSLDAQFAIEETRLNQSFDELQARLDLSREESDKQDTRIMFQESNKIAAQGRELEFKREALTNETKQREADRTQRREQFIVGTEQRESQFEQSLKQEGQIFTGRQEQQEGQFTRTLAFKNKQLDTDISQVQQKLGINEKQFKDQMGFNREKLMQDRELFLQDRFVKQANAKLQQQAKVLPELQNINNISADVMSAFTHFSKIPANLRGPIEGRTRGATASFMRSNAELKTYERFKKFITANISRHLGGERGVLTDKDVKRVEELLPDRTDTDATAKGAIKETLSFIDRRIRAKQQQAGLDPIGFGFDIEQKAKELSGSITPTGVSTTPNTPRTDSQSYLDSIGR